MSRSPSVCDSIAERELSPIRFSFQRHLGWRFRVESGFHAAGEERNIAALELSSRHNRFIVRRLSGTVCVP